MSTVRIAQVISRQVLSATEALSGCSVPSLIPTRNPHRLERSKLIIRTPETLRSFIASYSEVHRLLCTLCLRGRSWQ